MKLQHVVTPAYTARGLRAPINGGSFKECYFSILHAKWSCHSNMFGRSEKNGIFLLAQVGCKKNMKGNPLKNSHGVQALYR